MSILSEPVSFTVYRSQDDFFLGNGVSELIDLSLRALLNPGDEVLVPSPDYPLWSASTILNDGRPVYYPKGAYKVSSLTLAKAGDGIVGDNSGGMNGDDGTLLVSTVTGTTAAVQLAKRAGARVIERMSVGPGGVGWSRWGPALFRRVRVVVAGVACGVRVRRRW